MLSLRATPVCLIVVSLQALNYCCQDKTVSVMTFLFGRDVPESADFSVRRVELLLTHHNHGNVEYSGTQSTQYALTTDRPTPSVSPISA